MAFSYFRWGYWILKWMDEIALNLKASYYQVFIKYFNINFNANTRHALGGRKAQAGSKFGSASNATIYIWKQIYKPIEEKCWIVVLVWTEGKWNLLVVKNRVAKFNSGSPIHQGKRCCKFQVPSSLSWHNSWEFAHISIQSLPHGAYLLCERGGRNTIALELFVERCVKVPQESNKNHLNMLELIVK